MCDAEQVQPRHHERMPVAAEPVRAEMIANNKQDVWPRRVLAGIGHDLPRLPHEISLGHVQASY
jgi:hypothetical protein